MSIRDSGPSIVGAESKLFARPLSTDGLPTGNKNINPDGSATPVDYYIEALEGEELAISRAMIHVVDSGSFDSGSYGNGIVLANGMDLYFEKEGVKYSLSDGFPIKTNVDWGRWCYDINISTFGLGNESLDARWTFTKYGNPYGWVLKEGEKLGIRVNDLMTGLVEQTIIMQGTHLKIENPAWIELL